MASTLDTDFSTTTIRERDVRKNPIIAIGTECPFVARLPKGAAPMSSLYEWERKTYATPSNDGVIEGYVPGTSDADFQNNIAQRTLLKGRFQKFWRNVRVTKEAQLMVNQFTVAKDVLTDNTSDKLIELHRDIESTCLKDQESVAPAAGTTASKIRGAPRWLSNANGRFTDSDTTPASGNRTPDDSILENEATASTVSEDDVRGVLTSVATSRMKDSTGFLGVCRPLMRNQFTTFSLTDKNGSTSSNYPLRRWNGKENEVTAKVTRYNSDFGTVDLITSFLLDTTVHLLMLDLESWEIKYAQAPKITPLPFDGAGEKRMIDAILVLACLNPQANGKATSEATA
jgi:hypothetical protein